MISTGIHQGEFYRLDRSGSEIQVTCYRAEGDCEPLRGPMLAVALKGRKVMSPNVYYMTPARAEKWRQLFLAGFTARKRRIWDSFVWEFARGEGEGVTLAEAMNEVKAGEVLENENTTTSPLNTTGADYIVIGDTVERKVVA